MTNREEQKIISEGEYIWRRVGHMPTASFIRSTAGMSGIALRRAQKQHLETLQKWQERMNKVRDEYRKLIREGKLFSPSRIERLRMRARGHPDNISVQAARRLLAKMDLES